MPGGGAATGGRLASGSTAPLHTASFLDHATSGDQAIGHEHRLALALDIDQANRLLLQTPPIGENTTKLSPAHSNFVWRDSSWTRDRHIRSLASKKEAQVHSEKAIPTVPFRVLDAPNLKDDYYCSVLAYSYTCHTLAVALTQKVYLWTEQYGVRYPPLPPTRPTNFVTDLAFSSESGGRAILAAARNSGTVTLWSLLESRPRFEAPHSCAASCVSWKPTETYRPSIDGEDIIPCEDLLVGDDAGTIYYYSVEWPEFAPGSMTLIAKIDAHSQNICGLAWSPDAELFVSGGNDNRAFLYDPKIILEAKHELYVSGTTPEHPARPATPAEPEPSTTHAGLMTPPSSSGRNPNGNQMTTTNVHARLDAPAEGTGLETPPASPDRRESVPTQAPDSNTRWLRSQNGPAMHDLPPVRIDLADPNIPGISDMHVYAFHHSAAVKAIAFARWQPSLLATGGGSNDRQIHFFHTGSGATLAQINVFSQVTSLV
ncbi:hypothetical protein H2202_002742 [Exophiala xenobiotica]|nr:hypothetical protein H2202_002742 [Exophiala xenobiotica]